MSFALSQIFWEMEENLQHPEVAIELEKIFCIPLHRPSLPLISTTEKSGYLHSLSQ